MKEVCEVDTAAPGMVSLEVAVVGPRVSGKHVSAPQTHVKLVVLRTIPGMAAAPPASSPFRNKPRYRRSPAAR